MDKADNDIHNTNNIRIIEAYGGFIFVHDPDKVTWREAAAMLTVLWDDEDNIKSSRYN